MLLSKYNLEARCAASIRKEDPEFNRLQIEPDGCTVAADGRYVLAVGPVDEERASFFPPNDKPSVDPPPEGVGVSLKQATGVARAIPAGKPSLQFVQLTRCDERYVDLMSTDGARATTKHEAPARRRFPHWRGPLAVAARKATKGRVVLDGKGLLRVLQAVLRAANDPGRTTPIYVEFGDEEETLIAPAIQALRREGADVHGPVPADTVFWRARQGAFQGIVYLYHDQGNIAMKAAAFGEGVLIYTGLPFPVTSPGHGSALDIAGQGIADAGNLIEAIRLAARLAREG